MKMLYEIVIYANIEADSDVEAEQLYESRQFSIDGHEIYCYDGGGYRVEVDLMELEY